MSDKPDRADDELFISTFNETLNAMTEGFNPHQQFAILGDFLEIMRSDPIPELVLHKFCELAVENRMLTLMVQNSQDKAKKNVVEISLN